MPQDFAAPHRAELQSILADDPELWPVFDRRLRAVLPRLRDLLQRLYGDRPDFDWQFGRILKTAARALADRPAPLRQQDLSFEDGPDWFLDHRQVGAVCYVDLYAGDLEGIRGRIDHLQDLGITYLHLMPLLRSRVGENDGGYAVASYREVEPRLGTMSQLRGLAEELRKAGIRLCLDFVFNHTADDHEWALRAKAEDAHAQGYYRFFDDRMLPDLYQPNLREIFPDRGSQHFFWQDEAQKWVWSTFHTYQWDLNFANPRLFRRMLEEMMFLANQGVDILRLDAVPFIWKQVGTTCENLPGAHWLIQAYNALARIVAPSLVFKSEAIVHPDEVARYVHPDEAQISYCPLLMVLLWESLATRSSRLMRHSLEKRFALPPGSGWVTYVRSHDDIGWGFADEDADDLQINGHDHRQFLNAFYTGRFEGSFATGLPFQENPRNGDCRICGTTASLCGLERALAVGDEWQIELAVRRVLLIYGITLFIGGMPLIYLGDEVGQLNDYGYQDIDWKAGDARWVHRPETDWPAQERIRDATSLPQGRIHAGFQRMIDIRKRRPALSGQEMSVLPLDNEHVFGFLRPAGQDTVIVLANMTESPQILGDRKLRAMMAADPWDDLIRGEPMIYPLGIALEPYQLMCLVRADGTT